MSPHDSGDAHAGLACIKASRRKDLPVPKLIVPSRFRASRGARGTGAGFTLAAAVLGFFVIALDAVVVNVALPSIRRDLGGGITGLQWVVDGYILMFAALLLSAGALSDRQRGATGGRSAMIDWTAKDLDVIGAADELDIAPVRPDGSLRPYTTIWVVRVGDELYVRSYRGRRGSWFRHALQRHEGRIRAAGVERDVTLEEPDDADHDAIDQAYRSKYARYSNTYVEPMVSPNATAATLRLLTR
jgi:hypothetical protein